MTVTFAGASSKVWVWRDAASTTGRSASRAASTDFGAEAGWTYAAKARKTTSASAPAVPRYRIIPRIYSTEIRSNFIKDNVVTIAPGSLLYNSMLRKTLFILVFSSNAVAAGPPADTLKQVLTRKLMILKPSEATERNVLFQSVQPGSGMNTFRVTAIIRDYSPGYPKNRYYGQTCTRRF